MDGRKARKMPFGTDRAMDTAEGSIDKMIFSNFSVKSKFPRQPLMIGPNAVSSIHVAKYIVLSGRARHGFVTA